MLPTVCEHLGSPSSQGIRDPRKKIIEDAETKHWSKETLSNARRKLNRAQRAEIRSLRDMGDSRVALAEPDRYANIEGPEIRS